MFWWFYRLLGFYFRRRASGYGIECAHCGYDEFEMYDPPYFRCTASGSSYIPGEPTIYWFEGVQTCPRCRYNWQVADSN